MSTGVVHSSMEPHGWRQSLDSALMAEGRSLDEMSALIPPAPLVPMAGGGARSSVSAGASAPFDSHTAVMPWCAPDMHETPPAERGGGATSATVAGAPSERTAPSERSAPSASTPSASAPPAASSRATRPKKAFGAPQADGLRQTAWEPSQLDLSDVSSSPLTPPGVCPRPRPLPSPYIPPTIIR